MNQLTKLGLTLLAVAALCVTGCKKKPVNITPLGGAGQPAPTTGTFSGDPIRSTRPPSNPGTVPLSNGSPFNGSDGTGSKAVPFNTGGNNGGNPVGSPTGSDTTIKPLGDADAAPGPRGTGAEDRETLKGDTVYFDYDKSAIKSAEYAKVGAVAEYLKSNSTEDLVVEGHCDERGTEEYNRALGERRALAIRERLVNLGVPANRITTISYGKDRPVDVAHTEDAYAKNRRGEFVLLKGGSATK